MGKKIYGCDSTLESIKGTNKLYKDKNLENVNIVLSPPNPNRSFFEFSDFYKYLDVVDVDDLFETVAVCNRIDDIDQALGRTLGKRKEYRKKLGYEKIINYIFVYENDSITKEALMHSRYINPDVVEFKTLFVDPDVCLEMYDRSS